MDHVAIQVDDVRESVDWYVERFGCGIIYCDHTWALLQFDNIKLALVVEDEHPSAVAVMVPFSLQLAGVELSVKSSLQSV